MLPAMLPDGRPRPRLVCLVGSTRFFDAFTRANFEYTRSGHIVLTMAFAPDVAEHGESVGITADEKAQLDALHMDKVALSDFVVVINPGGYIGASTAREIAHAVALGKPVYWIASLQAELPPSCPYCTARCTLAELAWHCNHCQQDISPAILPLPSFEPPHTAGRTAEESDLDLALLQAMDWSKVDWYVRGSVIDVLQDAGVVPYADEPGDEVANVP